MNRALPRAIVLGVLAAGLALPTNAGAQIYSWRDAGGTLVLSDRKPDGRDVVTFPVAGAGAVRSTRAVGRTRAITDYEAIIDRHATAYGVRPELVRAVIQTESGFNPVALSSKGAMGLMQLMPATARDFGVTNPYDPDENVRGGVAYLKQLLTRYQGNEELALAAYNAGPGAVDRFGRRVPPFSETRNYLSRVRTATSISRVSRQRIYRTVEVVDGREVVRYTNVKPGPNAREVLAARRR